MNFRNLYAVSEPDSNLHQPEIDMLMSVIEKAITLAAPGAKQGNFVLYEQKFGEPARRILSFGLEEGHYMHPVTTPCLLISWTHSSTLARNSIREMLNLPESSLYRTCSESREPFTHSEDAPSGIYVGGPYQMLVVRNQYGRFLASCYLRTNPYGQVTDTSRAVLYAAAQAILAMSPTDEDLQSFRIEADGFYTAACSAVLQRIRKYIERRELSSIREWAVWHESAESHGILYPFFR